MTKGCPVEEILTECNIISYYTQICGIRDLSGETDSYHHDKSQSSPIMLNQSENFGLNPLSGTEIWGFITILVTIESKLMMR